MSRARSLHTLHRLCHRYGPGRLPRAENHSIGAGYAAATAAFAATLLFAAIVTGLEFILVGVLNSIPILVWIALAALPVVVPAAFVAGVLVWKLVTPTTNWLGAVAGVAGTLATYIAAFGILCVYTGVGVVLNIPSGDPAAAVGFSLTMALYGFVFTFWATIPVGCMSGVVYQNIVSHEVVTE